MNVLICELILFETLYLKVDSFYEQVGCMYLFLCLCLVLVANRCFFITIKTCDTV